jgi:DNA-binding transcriptional regulator GbsR (MarR family)
MHAEEISLVLQVARSNVSTSIRELQNWDLVKITHLAGDRRDHFETSLDPWELMRTIVRERKEREFDPTVAMLRECAEDPGFAKQDPGAQKRMRDTLTLMQSLSSWADQMLALETATLSKVVRLGAKVQSLVGGKAK